MIIQVLYRIDAHEYNQRKGRSSSSCRVCSIEKRFYGSFNDAVRYQPQDELARPDGDQGALDLPARRFQVVVVLHL
jgi:hypothetical protein